MVLDIIAFRALRVVVVHGAMPNELGMEWCGFCHAGVAVMIHVLDLVLDPSDAWNVPSELPTL